MRACLDQRAGQIALAFVARQLAVSTRTLQRALMSAGTTFRVEKTRARARHAARLLESGRRPKEVALTLGYTPPSFSAMFRRVAGVRPSSVCAQMDGPEPRRGSG